MPRINSWEFNKVSLVELNEQTPILKHHNSEVLDAGQNFDNTEGGPNRSPKFYSK